MAASNCSICPSDLGPGMVATYHLINKEPELHQVKIIGENDRTAVGHSYLVPETLVLEDLEMGSK
ncbi:hypothetical protein PENFLA_c020G01312 [Penicillium flavigenum]|uniref:Uncharacterized protein n=1 Tax=Penicillium flavigenum TaxID=254877 RepID=A0A1V6SY25_9EURO|nr:hypothetical protein PENFLA_c020G01312 [Penicillium flavigenum]